MYDSVETRAFPVVKSNGLRKIFCTGPSENELVIAAAYTNLLFEFIFSAKSNEGDLAG